MPNPYLNQDPFATGGVMDAPDPTVRLAMMKLMNPGGMPPMTQEEAQRLSTRMYLEGQSARNVPTSTQTMQMRQGGPIDVNTYAGSMYGAPGSYTAARLAPQGGSTMEQRADALLKQRFGTMLPGQTIREAGMRDEWMVPDQEPTPTPQTQAIGAGSFLGALKQPSGLETLLGTQFNATQAPQAPQAARPIQFGQSAQGMFPGYKTPSPAVLQQMIGQAAPQAPSMQNLTVGQAFGLTPKAQELSMERSKMQAQQQRQQEKDLLDTAVSMIASGQDVRGLNLTPSQLVRAQTEGALLAEKGQRTVETTNAQGQPIKQIYDINNRLIAERPIERLRPTAQEEAEAARLKAIAEGNVKAGQAQVEANTKAFDTAITAENAALIAEKGLLDPRTTTGFAAPVSTFFKRALEPFGLDVGLTEQLFTQKGLAGMQAAQIRQIMQGLGSMSNADREFAIQQFPAITDPKRNILFYVELAKENAKYAREDAKLQRSLLSKPNADPADVARQMEERRQSRNFVSDVYDRVMAKSLPQANVQPAGQGTASGVPLDAIAAEKKRRGLK